MAARIIMAAMGKSKDTRFFKTVEESLEWLKGKAD